MPTVKELEAKKKKLQGMNDDGSLDSDVEAIDSQIAALKNPGSDDDMIGTNITEEDYNKATSKFAQKGEWPALFGKPYVYGEAGVSICFPFRVPAPDVKPVASFEDDGMLWAGRGAEAAWKLKEFLTSLNVPFSYDKNGMLQFKASDVEGKIAKVSYVVEGTYAKEDPDTGEMVEVPSTIAKAKSILPMKAKVESLDI